MGFEEQIVEKIHQNSLKLLSEVGIAIHSGTVCDFLKNNGIRIEGNRAFFTEEQVMTAMDLAKKDFTVFARNEKYNVRMNTEDLYVTPGYGSPSIQNTDGTTRTAVFDDFLRLAEIVQVSDEFSINGGILAQPSDIDPSISAEVMVYATLCRSDKALFSVCGGGVQAENIMKMLRIVFDGSIEDKPCSFNLISTLSPLGLTQNTLETIEVCAKNGQPLVIAPGPMAGATGPISLAGNTSLANAEILGTNVYAQLVRPGTPLIYGFAATTSDMRSMKVSNAGPGFLKEARYGALMAKKYGLACRSGGGMSNAGGLTAQAGVESAMSLFESFTEKANLVMHATGSADSFNSVSYEKFILDIETINRMRYYFSALPCDEEALAFDAIKDAVEEGETFVSSEHTFDRCRVDPWYSQVSLHGKSHGDPNQELYASIKNKMNEMLDTYRIPSLPEEKRKALDEIMRELGMKEHDIAKV